MYNLKVGRISILEHLQIIIDKRKFIF